MKSNEIMVSICCITYNQEKYIKDALDSFLMQKTNFKYEIIIHDDASTDNTANIIKEYEKKYPDIVKPIYQTENQYKKGKRVSIPVYKKANGRYIAVCEGDDYWTDENKLQMQVDYMESHCDCSFCFHNAMIINELSNKKRIFLPHNKNVKKYFKKDNKYNVGELEMLEFIPTASFMFRRENFEKMPEWYATCFVGDWALRLVMTSFGYAYYIDKIMCVYRRNAIGSITNKNEKRERESIKGKKYILEKKEEFVNLIDEFTQNQYKKVFDIRRAQYDIERLFVEGNEKEILKKGYLKLFNKKEKIKCLIKVYFPNVVRKYKEIKRSIGENQ